MTLTRLLIPAVIILLTGWRAPAYCQHWDFTATGAAFRTDTTNGRQYAHAVQSDTHCEYGPIVSDAPGFPAFLALGHRPRVNMSVRLDATGAITSTRMAFHSTPPGGGCPWPNNPGASWMPSNVAGGILWDLGLDPTIYQNFPNTTGPDAAVGTIATGFTVRLPVCMDDVFVWWASGWNDGENVSTFCYAMQVPPTQTAYLTVSAPQECEPFLFGGGDAWWLHQRCDFSFRVFAVDPPTTDADFDGDSDVDDLFTFLARWFRSEPAADWDGVAGCGIADIFAFLSDWMAH